MLIGWCTYVEEVNGEEIVGSFYEKEVHKTNKKNKIRKSN